MQIAVTGGSGQLGSVLVRKLIDDAAITRIVVLDVAPPTWVSPKLRWAKIDVRDPAIAEAMAGCDALVHLAFVVTKYLPHEEVEAINIGGSRNVFAAVLRAGVRQIVYASSVASYGVVPGHAEPMVETEPRIRQPAFPYASTKFDVETILDGIEQNHPALRIVRLRPGIFCGEHMDHAMGAGLRARTLLDAGDTPLPIVADEDVADAFVLALKKNAHGAYNLMADELLTTRELATRLGLRVVPSSAFAEKVAAVVLGAAARLGLSPPADPSWLTVARVRMTLDCTKAKQELGWAPTYPTAEAVIRRTLELAPGPLARPIAIFFSLVGAAAERRPPEAALAGVTARVRVRLTGAGGGDVGFVVEDGRLRTTRRPPRPPTSVLTLPAALFRRLLAGEADLAATLDSDAIAVEGEPAAVLLLAGLVSTFRQETAAPSWRGHVAGALSSWLATGKETLSSL